jgi:hypothetical protein
MIYTYIDSLYCDIIKYNEEDLIYTGEHNLPISNKYYIFITDTNNHDFMRFYNNLFIDIEGNPLQDIRVNFDEDQVFLYDVLKYNFKTTDKILCELYNNANEEGGEVCVILDIGYILNFIRLTEENSSVENHIFDYLSYKLRNKVDKLFILDEKQELGHNSLLYRDIHSFNKNSDKTNKRIPMLYYDNKKEYLENNYITIYKNNNNLYWKILDTNSTIDFSEDYGEDHDYEDKIIEVKIDKINSLITLTEIDDEILDGNVFIRENMTKVLHPITKNSIYYD